jgi:RNA polymerase sigma-70 factor (ECF subfamily)
MRDEAELIEAAIGGDQSAFGELVKLKRERVVRTAYQITGNMDDALDVAQAVFIKVWQGMDKFDPRRRFDTWIYRITSNAAIDLLRSRGPLGTQQPLPDDPAELETSERGKPAEESIDLQRLQQAFRHLAGRLAPKQRAAFVLREIEGLPTSEVARIMDVTESTVRNHLLQTRRLLKAGLLKEYRELLPVSLRETHARGDRDDRNGEGQE